MEDVCQATRTDQITVANRRKLQTSTLEAGGPHNKYVRLSPTSDKVHHRMQTLKRSSAKTDIHVKRTSLSSCRVFGCQPTYARVPGPHIHASGSLSLSQALGRARSPARRDYNTTYCRLGNFDLVVVGPQSSHVGLKRATAAWTKSGKAWMNRVFPKLRTRPRVQQYTLRSCEKFRVCNYYI